MALKTKYELLKWVYKMKCEEYVLRSCEMVKAIKFTMEDINDDKKQEEFVKAMCDLKGEDSISGTIFANLFQFMALGYSENGYYAAKIAGNIMFYKADDFEKLYYKPDYN